MFWIITAVTALIAIFTVMPASTQPAFKVGIEMPTQVPVTHAVEAALKDIGISYINYYVNAAPGSDLPASDINQEMMKLCKMLGLDFSIACHHIDPPDDCVKAAVNSDIKGKFRGVVFDELEHCRLMNNYSPIPLADPATFKDLNHAYNSTVDSYKKLQSKFAALGSTATATHVWPVMDHIAAETGFIVCPKICKEFYSPVSLAIGMGAAKQYGRELWVDCDLWFWDLIPGHTPEEMKSNLLLAYWMGVDLVYVEGSGFNLYPAGKQGIPFSMMTQITPDVYQLTPHGEALRWFCKDYLPKHPRPWSFRDVKPDIAIIRFEDTCHGQRYAAGFPDSLYGCSNLHSNRDTEAWLGLWNLLTFGKTGRDGLSFFKSWVAQSGYQKGVQKDLAQSYLSRPTQADQHKFFVPLNGTVVYDHKVDYELLKEVPLIVLTGIEVSPKTMDAVRRCVKDGAICLAWGPLAKKNGFNDWESGFKVIPEGKGRFILTDDFGYGKVYEEIKPFIGYPDTIRYRFGNHQVSLKKVTDNEVAVEISEK